MISRAIFNILEVPSLAFTAERLHITRDVAKGGGNAVKKNEGYKYDKVNDPVFVNISPFGVKGIYLKPAK